jgi:hypothetical protein
MSSKGPSGEVVFQPRQPKSPAKSGAHDDDEPSSRMQDPVALGAATLVPPETPACCVLRAVALLAAHPGMRPSRPPQRARRDPCYGILLLTQQYRQDW